MKVATVYIATDGGTFDGFTHLLVNRRLMLGTTRESVTIDRTCGEVHDMRIDYMECPVASRWTLVNQPRCNWCSLPIEGPTIHVGALIACSDGCAQHLQ